MNANLLRGRLLASTVIAGAIVSAPAFAQNSAPAGTEPAKQAASNNSMSVDNDVIVVTGSRIPQPNLTSASPVTVIGSAEVKQQGTTRVEDLLNSLPQVFANEGSSDANGASGISTVDLRDLGPSRTLVLINGRRLGPGDPTDPVSDLNEVPAALIKSVEVLTGGASSIYGSDALAGVVNFKLDRDFEGVQLDAQYSLYNHDNRLDDAGVLGAFAARNYSPPRGNTADGFQKTVNITIGAGTDDGRGHVTAYAGWRQVDALTQGDRDYSYCGLSGSLQDGNGVVCGGSSTNVNGRFRRTVNIADPGQVPVYNPTGPSLTTDPGAPGTFRTYNTSRDGFNFNPYNFYQRPDERYTLGAFAHYEVSKAFDPYVEVMFMDDHTKAQIAPSGAFYGTDFFVNCNNPLLSAAQQTSICGPTVRPEVGPATGAGTNTLQSLYIGRRNYEGGGRVDDLRHTDYRIVVGAKGQIGKGITYDVYGQLNRAILSENYQNDFSRARLNRALNVVVGPNGTPVCASAIPNGQGQVLDPNCVPYNIFGTVPGGVSQAAINYLQTPGFKSGQTSEYVVNGSITATLGDYGIQSPWASDGIGVNIGGEYRKEALLLQNDAEFLTGDLAGQGTPFGVPNAKGAFDVKEGFIEVNIPIATDKPFFENLVLDGSYRHSSYSSVGSTDTYKGQVTWSPIKDITFRGAYNRAVRAPNILELFNPATVQLFSSPGQDPCSGAIPSATLAQCANSGVTAAQYGNIDASPAFQYNQRTSGNANLRPEVSDSYTAGIVLQPRFLRNFVVSADLFSIKIKDLISTVGADFSLTQCTQTGNPFFCNNINRAAGSGSLFTGNSFVDNQTLNLGAEKTRGIDINASYNVEVSHFGRFGFDLVGTYLDQFKVTPIGGINNVGTYDCAGYFGSTCGTPLPKWRSKLRVTWTTPIGLEFSAAWRYFGKVNNDLDSPDTLLNGSFDRVANECTVGQPNSACQGLTSHIPSQSYFDLTMTARVDKFTFRVGAQNIADKSPPITPGYTTNGSNTYAQVYDSRGRYIYAGVTLNF